ncbi:Fibronectin type III domain-containing protein 5, partial [Acipenser ruthenus]
VSEKSPELPSHFGHQSCFLFRNQKMCLFFFVDFSFSLVSDSPTAPVNVTIKHLKANSAEVSWDTLDADIVIGFAISQQKKDMLRFIQELNTTTRSCTLWDLEQDTEYLVHVQSISLSGTSPASDPVLFRTLKEAEKQQSKSKGTEYTCVAVALRFTFKLCSEPVLPLGHWIW